MAVVEGVGLADGLGAADGRTPTLAVGLADGISICAGYSTEGPVVWVSVSRVIGSVALLTGLYSAKVRVSVSRVIGSVELLAGSTIGATASVSRVIGRVRGRVKPLGSPWPGSTEIGLGPCGYGDLPLPTKDGYEYSTNPMLSRTEFESGVIRQRRRGSANYKPASATVMVTGAQLVILEGILADVGVEWWNLPMITGDSAGAVALHTVRVTGPLRYSMIEYDLFKASFDLELQ